MQYPLGNMRRLRLTATQAEKGQNRMVYVLNENGQPLMPTKRYGKVRHLLKDGKAKVVKRCPFTIQLTYSTPDRVQPIDLGIDSGSVHIGISSCTNKAELYSEECILRDDINKNLQQRHTLRRSRRNRKTRYRKPRFQNRTHSRKKGWLAPSVKEKCQTHITVVKKVLEILPVSSITVEMAPFDTQKLKAQLAGTDVPKGTDYQHGETEGFDNVKAYVKWRDGCQCRICGSHEQIQIHHRQQRKDGGSNSPDNLICVCAKCHKAFHAGELSGKKANQMLPGDVPKAMNSAAFMGIMRWAVWNELKKFGLQMHMSFGHITAKQRKENHLDKSHRNDARCISGHGDVPPADEYFLTKKVRCHNRQLHKLMINKGGTRKNNQAPYKVKGFRLFDKVQLAGVVGFVFGRRYTGRFSVRRLDGTKVCENAPAAKLTLLETGKVFLIERRTVLRPWASPGVTAPV